MPIDYQLAKIYKITAPTSNEVYIGSTTKRYLSSRLAVHRTLFSNWKECKQEMYSSSYVLFEKYGKENCTIQLIEDFPCSSKMELLEREQYHLERHPNAVNVNRAFKYRVRDVQNQNKPFSDEEIDKMKKEYTRNYMRTYFQNNDSKRLKNIENVKKKYHLQKEFLRLSCIKV